MTTLLLRLFVKNYQHTEKPEVRTATGKLAGLVGIVCNLLLFGFKFLVGTLTASVSITADAVNNLSDASSSLISLLGFKMGSRPADAEHPYGHARYEYLAGLTVTVTILVIGVELMKSSITKILHPEPVEFKLVSVFVLLAAILVKLWMAFFNYKMGDRINSETLKATSADSRNDVISTAIVLIASLVSYFSKLELDGYMGVAVAIFILFSGVCLFHDTLDPLLGKAPDKELVNQIESTIMSYDGVLGTHDLMIHDYGPGRQFASVHVEVPAEEEILKSHDIVDNIERDLFEEHGIQLVVHMDPIVTKDESIGDLRGFIANEIKQIHPKLSIHDLRIVPGPTHTNVIFDCVVPHELSMSDTELKDAISALVQKSHPDYFCVITVDHSYVKINS